MKELCDKLMKLNPVLPFGKDYSTLALALYLQENDYCKNKSYSVFDYVIYLYRFYSDIEIARKNHYHKLINEINHYQPSDLYDYGRGVLKYVEESIGLICVRGDCFVIENCPEEIGKYEKLMNGVIQTLISKFLGSEYKQYDSRISNDEVKGNSIYTENSRIFYRAMEVLNYCFISDETSKKELCAVSLSESEYFKENNYLLLKREYAELYVEKRLVIKRNGYAYLDGKRMYEHIEIAALKKIRDYLPEM